MRDSKMTGDGIFGWTYDLIVESWGGLRNLLSSAFPLSIEKQESYREGGFPKWVRPRSPQPVLHNRVVTTAV
jgi:hypothetical protein